MADPLIMGLPRRVVFKSSKGNGVEAHGMKRYGGYPLVVKRSHTNLLIALLPIPMTCGSACAIEKHINEFIAYYGGAIEKHLVDSLSFYKRLN